MIRKFCTPYIVFIIVYALAHANALAAAPERLALIIGNGDYTRSPLTNPANDARDIAEELKQFGFDVILKTDVDKRAMVAAMRDFGERLRNGGVGLFYFSGHGLQSQNLNYLLPLKAGIQAELDIEFEAVSANRILATMEQANDLGVNIIILDACRDNPYKSYMKSAGAGLARMDSPMGSLLAYATAPGTVAYGDNLERNSIYTKHLLTALREMPNSTITDLFIAVRNGVIQDTGRRQVPWESVSLTQQFCLDGCYAPQPQAQAQAEIAQLLQACERHFQANRLTSGRGGTAVACYEEVLEREASNAEALAGLDRIEAKYAEWAQRAITRGDVAKTRQYLVGWRLVNPESPALAVMEEQLQQSNPPDAGQQGQVWNQGVWNQSRWR